MTREVSIRLEHEADHDTVRSINEAAFGQPDEAKLVDALRETVDPCISLVAERDGEIVGHILFSPVTVEPNAETGLESWSALGLAPMAVAPDCQRQGIGGELIHAGLEICANRGHSIVFVLGHPEYYPRFGFTPAPPLGLLCEYPVPDELFMVAELESGAIAERTGLIKYAPAFDAL